MIRVMIVDDQPLIRASLRMMVESQPDFAFAGEAGDGAAAVVSVRRAEPDIVLMDIRMPGMDGIEASATILASSTRIRILVLTTFDADEYVYEALRLGVSGFLLKDSTPEQIVTAIRTVATGDLLLAPTVTRRLVEQYVRRPRAVDQSSSSLATLTDRERDVLIQLAQGLSNVEIAERLYVSEGTVKTHVSRTLAKLGVRDRVQAVIAAYESGLVQPGGESAPSP